MDIEDAGGAVAASIQGFSDDEGTASLQWKIPRRQAPGSYSAKVTQIIKTGFVFTGGGLSSVAFTIE